MSIFIKETSIIDTIEDQINSQIQQLEQLKQNLERQMQTAKNMRPDLERRYMNACDSIGKKREKLQKFHVYNAKSASIFSEYEASQQEFSRGLAQVQNSKAWNASTGTFNLGQLDMSWAVSINERWERHEKMKEEVRNIEVKKALGKLDGYTIIRTELGEWYLMKNRKYIFADQYPELYAELEKCKNYLAKDQYSDEKLKINRDEITFVPGIGGVGLLGKGADILRKGTGVIRIGKNIVDAINNAPSINLSTEKKVNEVLKDATDTTRKKGNAKNYEKEGGIDEAIDDFNSFNPNNVKTIDTKYGEGLQGVLDDGTTISVRPGSETGGSTLEIKVPGTKIKKIRYNK